MSKITIFSLKDKLNFGKHKDSTLEHVITEFPEYIQWALKKINWFDIDKEAKKVLVDVMEWKNV